MSKGALTLVGTLVRDKDGAWYTIEWAEHDGTSGLRRMGENVYAFWHSGRVSDADVEGTADEMRGIAKAIRERGYYAARRCAVQVNETGVEFWSPRNSMGSASVSLATADALADEIESKLGLDVEGGGQ